MKAHIEYLINSDSYGIWFIQTIGNRKYKMKPVKVEFEEVLPNQFHPVPSLEISNEYSKDFLESLAEALASKGISKSNEKVAGLYEAQSKHLEDLQKIVFKESNDKT